MTNKHQPLETFIKTHASYKNALGAANVDLQIIPKLTQINLRGNPQDKHFINSVKKAIGGKLPLQHNTIDANKDTRLCWLGPNEWLIICEHDLEEDLLCRLQESLVGQHAALSSLSSGQLCIRLSGRDVEKMLAKGCTVDLHPDVFFVGCCVQTLIAKTAVLIIKMDEKPVFDIIIRNSFAEYLVLWFYKAALEFGLNIIKEENDEERQ